MMAVLELYGKCKQLGYCDCGGFFGCVDPNSPLPHTDDPVELRNAMEAERQTSNYTNHNLARLIDCTVCDRSHTVDHPHIANIDGDIPIDEPAEEPPKPTSVIPPPAELPDWLKDKPGSHMIRPAARQSDAEAKCEDCGKIKRSNHKCKGQPKAETAKVAERCEDCKRAGELCVRHGGVWSDYDTPKGRDERVAKTLPAPVSVMQSETTGTCRNGHPKTPENAYIRSDGRRECKQCKKDYKNTARPALPVEADRELAAIGTVLRAVEGLGSNQLKRVMSYVAARLEETEL